MGRGCIPKDNSTLTIRCGRAPARNIKITSRMFRVSQENDPPADSLSYIQELPIKSVCSDGMKIAKPVQTDVRKNVTIAHRFWGLTGLSEAGNLV